MNRNEAFSGLNVASISVRLAWGSVEATVDDVQDIQLLISGSDEDVTGLKIGCVNGNLEVEQPNLGLPPRLNSAHWMQLVVRLPKDWKGAAEFIATSGRVNVRGLTGTDLTLGTISGDLTAANLQGMTCTLQTVSGQLCASSVHCEQLTMRAVSSPIRMEEGSFSQAHINSVAGDMTLMLTQPFDLLEATSVSGSLYVEAPLESVRVLHRSISGKLRATGVTIHEGGVPVSLNTVSGDLEIIGTNLE